MGKRYGVLLSWLTLQELRLEEVINTYCQTFSPKWKHHIQNDCAFRTFSRLCREGWTFRGLRNAIFTPFHLSTEQNVFGKYISQLWKSDVEFTPYYTTVASTLCWTVFLFASGLPSTSPVGQGRCLLGWKATGGRSKTIFWKTDAKLPCFFKLVWIWLGVRIFKTSPHVRVKGFGSLAIKQKSLGHLTIVGVAWRMVHVKSCSYISSKWSGSVLNWNVFFQIHLRVCKLNMNSFQLLIWKFHYCSKMYRCHWCFKYLNINANPKLDIAWLTILKRWNEITLRIQRGKPTYKRDLRDTVHLGASKFLTIYRIWIYDSERKMWIWNAYVKKLLLNLACLCYTPWPALSNSLITWCGEWKH